MTSFINSLFTAEELAAFDPSVAFTSASKSRPAPQKLFTSPSGAHIWSSILGASSARSSAPPAEAEWDFLKLCHQSYGGSSVHLTIARSDKNLTEAARQLQAHDPSIISYKIEDQGGLLLITRKPLGLSSCAGSGITLVESTTRPVDQTEIPSAVICQSVRETFECFLINSGEWWPIHDAENIEGGATYLWRQSLPQWHDHEDQFKIVGIKLGAIERKADHFRLAFAARSYVHKAREAPVVSCLPKLSAGLAVSAPYAFTSSPTFPSWNALREYWLAKYCYDLSENSAATGICVDIQFGAHMQFTYPLECVIPGSVKFGPMTSFVERPVILPLIKTALRKLVVASPGVWNTAFVTAQNALPEPTRSFNSRRQVAPLPPQVQAIAEIVKATATSPTLTANEICDDTWCRDLDFSGAEDANEVSADTAEPVAANGGSATAPAPAAEPTALSTKTTTLGGKKLQVKAKRSTTKRACEEVEDSLTAAAAAPGSEARSATRVTAKKTRKSSGGSAGAGENSLGGGEARPTKTRRTK